MALPLGPEGYLRYQGLAVIDGTAQQVQVGAGLGLWPYTAAGPGLIARLQSAAPQITPLPANKLDLGDIGLVLLP